MKIPKKQLFMEAQYSPGALTPFTSIFLILGNAARCAPLKIPQNASEDDICVLFFHSVLSTDGTYTMYVVSAKKKKMGGGGRRMMGRG